MKKKHYNARWTDPVSISTIGNVSFESSHDANAIKQADKIGREIGLPNTPRTVYEGSRHVHTKGSGQ